MFTQSKQPAFCRFSLTSLLVPVLLIVAVVPEGRAQESPTEDSYFSFKGEVPVTVALDRVGILPAQGVTDDEIEAFADEGGFEILRRLPGRIFILEVEQRSRSELVAFARDFRRTEEVVGQAGLVVTPEGAETPQILTDQFVVEFEPGTSRDEIESLNAARGVEILMEDPANENAFLLTVTEESEQDALDMANFYHQEAPTEFGEPNFLVVTDLRPTGSTELPRFKQLIPNDPFFGNQWHHRNTGQNGGTSDADLDTPQAWDITMGSQNTVVAVYDSGFDVDGPNPHPDLAPNLWQNPGETAGNGSDDDGNGYVDDVNGWDFSPCRPDDDRDGRVDEDPVDGIDNDGDGQVDEDPFTPRTCGDNTLAGGRHGTSTAGGVAAEADNNEGVSGTCPDCRLMLLRLGGGSSAQASFWAHRLGFQYARQEGADIISNSWGYRGGRRPNTVVRAINAAARSGVFVLFAMNNWPYQENCGADVSTLPSVFSVSASNNLDTRSPSGYGDCMEVIAPTFEGDPSNINPIAPNGTLGAATTDVQGGGGYNTGSSSSCATSSGSVSDLSNNDYTRCFGGTSFATPSTAGVAGLILSEDPSLTRLQVRRLLQDTGDKIQDPVASYRTDNGRSDPSSVPSSWSSSTVASTHGWGRVNAFEAVRVADQGIDVFARDHRLDWGNTERPTGTLIGQWWHSVDVKIDAPPYELSTPAASAAEFANKLTDEDAISGAKNRVYVRVRNRGPNSASSVDVSLHWEFAGAGSLPTWPWSSGQQINTKSISSVPYSGSSVAGPAGGPGDPAQVVSFEWTAPAPRAGQPNPDHFCLLAKLDGGSQDPPLSRTGRLGNIVPHDNNFVLDNLKVVNTATALPPGGFAERFYVGNPLKEPVDVRLVTEAPEGWEAFFEELPQDEPISFEAGERRLATLRVVPPERGAEGEVRAMQKAQLGEEQEQVVLGGMTYRFRPREGLVGASGLEISEDGLVDFGQTGVTINFVGTEGSGDVVVKRFNTSPTSVEGIPEENVSLYRFSVDSKGDLGVGDDTEVRFDADRLDGIEDPTNVTIYRRDAVGEGAFTALPTTYEASPGDLVAPTGSFSEFVLASNTEPLPVELASFEAEKTGEASVALAWQTASETKNAGFEVQHKGPAKRETWSKIGFVESKAPGGTTIEVRRYQFEAEDLTVGTHRFRLKQKGLGGSTVLSDPVTMELQMQEALKLTAPAPNPVSSTATLSFAVKDRAHATVAVYDLLGRKAATLFEGTPTPGESTRLRLDAEGLPSGSYIIRLRADGKTETRRMTVVQ